MGLFSRPIFCPMNENNKIKITISGRTGVGKSVVSMIIKLALRAGGINYVVAGTIEEHEDNEPHVLEHFKEKVDMVKHKAYVEINQTNTNIMPGGVIVTGKHN